MINYKRGEIIKRCRLKATFLAMCAAAGDAVWIGLNDRHVEGLFDWTDHSTVRFTSWEYGNPQLKSDQEDCVFIRGEVRREVPSSKYLTPSKKKGPKEQVCQNSVIEGWVFCSTR